MKIAGIAVCIVVAAAVIDVVGFLIAVELCDGRGLASGFQ